MTTTQSFCVSITDESDCSVSSCDGSVVSTATTLLDCSGDIPRPIYSMMVNKIDQSDRCVISDALACTSSVISLAACLCRSCESVEDVGGGRDKRTLRDDRVCEGV